MLRLLRKYSDFDPELSSFEKWLFSHARYAVLEHRRQTRCLVRIPRGHELPSVLELNFNQPTWDPIEAVDARLDVRARLSHVPYGYVMAMYHGLDGIPLTFPEIGKLLGVSSTSAANFYRRARRAYRALDNA